MAQKDKGLATTMAIRVLNGQGIPYEVHLHAHKQVTSAWVAEDLGVPVAQVVKAKLAQWSARQAGLGEFAVIVIPGDCRLSLKNPVRSWATRAAGRRPSVMWCELPVTR